MMSALMLTLGAFLLTLGVLITVHEYGHYRVARACGVKVLRFSLGFGPVVWRRKLGVDGTEFVLSAIALGGYVRMLDEADGPVTAADLPRAFNRRPVWQRALIVLAGPFANFALAIILISAAQWHGVHQLAPVLGTPPSASLSERAGLRAGDRVEAVANNDTLDSWRPIRSFDEIYEVTASALLTRSPLRLRVRRGETDTHTFTLPLDTLQSRELDSATAARIGLGMPFSLPVLGDILANGPAARAGLQRGDLIVSVDGVAIADAQALRERIRAQAALDTQTRAGGVETHTPPAMQWALMRGGNQLTLAVQPRVVDEHGKRVGRVDAVIGTPYLRTLVREAPVEALQFGIVDTWRRAALSLRLLGGMLTGQTSLKHLSGPITIADVAGKSASRGFIDYLLFLAQVSVGIGVLNLLPLPMLDGGRLLYYLVEGATGRPVSNLWLARLQRGGIMIILLLMSLALTNDVARLLGLQ